MVSTEGNSLSLKDFFPKDTEPPLDSREYRSSPKARDQLAHQGVGFLQEEYVDMMDKQQWTTSLDLCLAITANLAGTQLRSHNALALSRSLPHRLDRLSETQPEGERENQQQALVLWARDSTTPCKHPSLDWIFRPLDALDTPFRQEQASVKKLLKGDATCTTKKIILGWLIDSINKTISLPWHPLE
eukprot:jgi/Psemu1/39948/gm1.39948_g